MTGREELSYTGGWMNSSSPVKVSTETEDPLQWALTEAGYGFKEFEKGPSDVKLTPDDLNDIHKRMHRLGLRDALTEVVESAEFNDLLKSWDRRPIDPEETNARPPHIKMITKTINSVRRIAIMERAAQVDEFENRLVRAKQRAMDTKEGIFNKAPKQTGFDKLTNMPN
jgi:hypothetical protein